MTQHKKCSTFALVLDSASASTRAIRARRSPRHSSLPGVLSRRGVAIRSAVRPISSKMGLFCLLLGMTISTQAQTSANALSSEFAPPAVLAAQHSVVRWSGVVASARNAKPGVDVGATVEMQFAIYGEQSGGLALWTEAQSVKLDSEGRYSVLLGAATSEGLPQTLFPAGEPRWVEAHLAGSSLKVASETSEPTRTLLAAVPYAYKSVDAETLAGRAATDYVTHEDLKQYAAGIVFPGGPTSGLSGATPAVTGTGTTNYIPLWTSSTNFGNSIMTQSGVNIGIETTAPASTLDVNGTATVRGSLILPSNGTATTGAGTSSHSVEFGSSTYSSSTHAAVAQTFKFQAYSVGNNTASPSATVEFLYGAGTATPVATGLSFASNGRITFAPGQTFPGAAGTGTITGITTTSPLAGSGTSGSVALSLNTAALETTLNGKYAQLATANNFTSSGTWAGPITGNSGGTMYAIQGNTSAGFGVEGMSTGTGGIGVDGYSTGNGAIGVYGNVSGNANGKTLPIGVLAHALQGYGVKSSVDESTDNYASILGQANGASGTYNNVITDGSVSAGVWGDIADSNNVSFSVGVVGTTDNGWAGYYANNSSTYPTIEAYNYNSGNVGTLFKTFKAGGPGGACGISGQGNLSCTGQVKTLVSTGGGQRTVETYSVQSPENWMEDFGAADLHSGSAIVTIDAAFAETVSGSADYHVFLTPRGDSKGLYVTNLTPTTFEVHESGSGSASIGFDYRIVAKRRGFEGQRLTDVTESFKKEMAVTPGMKTGLGVVGKVQP